ncbi:MAG: hypothetical protein QE285_07770 [Aquabacterium sp.]|nr:hypothetical protein [Aquabacterium sp.]
MKTAAQPETGSCPVAGRPGRAVNAALARNAVLILTDRDFATHEMARNQIVFVGLQLVPNGSLLNVPMTLKRIELTLP